MDRDGVVWGGQSTPGWKWRRIVYQQNQNPTTHLYQRFFNCKPFFVFIAFDLAVRRRLLSNWKKSSSYGTYTIGMNLEISPQRLASEVVTLARCFSSDITSLGGGILSRHQGILHNDTHTYLLSLHFCPPAMPCVSRAKINNMQQ